MMTTMREPNSNRSLTLVRPTQEQQLPALPLVRAKTREEKRIRRQLTTELAAMQGMLRKEVAAQEHNRHMVNHAAVTFSELVEDADDLLSQPRGSWAQRHLESFTEDIAEDAKYHMRRTLFAGMRAQGVYAGNELPTALMEQSFLERWLGD